MKKIKRVFVIAIVLILGLFINVNADTVHYEFQINYDGNTVYGDGDFKQDDVFELQLYCNTAGINCNSVTQAGEVLELWLLVDPDVFELVPFDGDEPFKIYNSVFKTETYYESNPSYDNDKLKGY